jgi:hypothetical protein
MTDVDMASPFVTSFMVNSSLCNAQYHRHEYHAPRGNRGQGSELILVSLYNPTT